MSRVLRITSRILGNFTSTITRGRWYGKLRSIVVGELFQNVNLYIRRDSKIHFKKFGTLVKRFNSYVKINSKNTFVIYNSKTVNIDLEVFFLGISKENFSVKQSDIILNIKRYKPYINFKNFNTEVNFKKTNYISNFKNGSLIRNKYIYDLNLTKSITIRD